MYTYTRNIIVIHTGLQSVPENIIQIRIFEYFQKVFAYEIPNTYFNYFYDI